MKNIFRKISDGCKKVSRIFKMIFGYGIMITLFVGGLTFFGYLAAIIIGGDTAAAICEFIYKMIVPYMIYATTTMVLFGLVTMYLAGELALTAKKSENKTTDSARK